MHLDQNYVPPHEDIDGDQNMIEATTPQLTLVSGALNLEGLPLEGEVPEYGAEVKTQLKSGITKVQEGLEDLSQQMQTQVAPRFLCETYEYIKEDLKNLIDIHAHYCNTILSSKDATEETKKFFNDMKEEIKAYYTIFRKQRITISKIMTDKENMDAVMKTRLIQKEGNTKKTLVENEKH